MTECVTGSYTRHCIAYQYSDAIMGAMVSEITTLYLYDFIYPSGKTNNNMKDLFYSGKK